MAQWKTLEQELPAEGEVKVALVSRNDKIQEVLIRRKGERYNATFLYLMPDDFESKIIAWCDFPESHKCEGCGKLLTEPVMEETEYVSGDRRYRKARRERWICDSCIELMFGSK